MTWETVIGIEVHSQLTTQSKIFSGAATAYGAEANTQACAVDLGLPGVLPVLNERVIELALRFGLAIDAEIADRSVFARKNYFYPDLPKGYQISQFDAPIVGKGTLDITLENGETKTIGITRAHLEEDAGKSLHRPKQGVSGIDLNRAGTPLLEIVSDPDMRSSEEAIAYLKTLHQLVRYLGISDGNMQEGSFRCDINISLRPVGQKEFGTRAEIKNINSFRFVKQAIAYEVERQMDILESGGQVVQETRLYDPDRDETRSMRSKEEANDYRYFPDPDLLPVVITAADRQLAKASLPELPWIRKQRFIDEYQFKADDAAQLTLSKSVADYFEAVLSSAKDLQPKLVANWVTGELSAYLKKHQLRLADCPVAAEQLAALLSQLTQDTISSSAAKTVFESMWETGKDPVTLIKEKGLEQVSDSGELESMLEDIIAQNPQQVAEFQAGKTKLMAFFVGQMMKLSKGKANPKAVTELIKKRMTTNECDNKE